MPVQAQHAKALHLRVGLGPQQRRPPKAAVAAAPAAGEDDGMAESQGDAPVPTMHLSQLPDVSCSQQPVSAEQDSSAAAATATAAAGTAGSIWYLCRTVLKGLNTSGSDDQGAAQSFDGL